MQLSERVVMGNALMDGDYNVYPVGKFFDLIKGALKDDNLSAEFDPKTTVKKIRAAFKKVHVNAVATADFEMFCKRLERQDASYDFDSEHEKIVRELPRLVKTYFGLNDFTGVTSKVVKYFFEGYSDLYKNADWMAFNVNPLESKQLKVPIGVFYKKSWVNPLHTSWSILHENLHRVQAIISTPEQLQLYVPWLDEGMNDAIAAIMLAKVRGDPSSLVKIRKQVQEIEMLNPRKAAYFYGLNIVINMLRATDMSFLHALFAIRKDHVYEMDWNVLSNGIRDGKNPYSLIPLMFTGADKSAFEKKFLKIDKELSKIYKFDDMDRSVLQMFSSMQQPSLLSCDEYRAAQWLFDQVTNKKEQNVAELEEDKLVPVKEVPQDKRGIDFYMRTVVLSGSVPKEIEAGVKELTKKYFVVEREIEGKLVLDPWTGGLPYRLGCGEIRCQLDG